MTEIDADDVRKQWSKTTSIMDDNWRFSIMMYYDAAICIVALISFFFLMVYGRIIATFLCHISLDWINISRLL